MLLATDPGLRLMGAALFTDDGKLFACSLVRNPIKPPVRGPRAWYGMAYALLQWVESECAPNGARLIDRLATEHPVLYPRYKGETHPDPMDILEMNGVVGAITGMLGNATDLKDITGYVPREWKSNVPSSKFCGRVEDYLKLFPEEYAIAPPRNAKPGANKNVTDNVWDAIGIGLYKLGRLGFGGVPLIRPTSP